MGAALALSMQFQRGWTALPAGQATNNPLVGNYRTKDDKFVSMACLQAAKYWPEACEIVGRPELATDERFADTASITANASVAHDLLAEVFAQHTVEEWRDKLEPFSGQWTVVQDTLEAAADPQTVANGLIADCQTAEGVPFRLATAPVQFDEEPAQPQRAPEFNEHGDEILTGLGFDMDQIIELKVRGVVT